jgi:hypothetical protein
VDQQPSDPEVGTGLLPGLYGVMSMDPGFYEDLAGRLRARSGQELRGSVAPFARIPVPPLLVKPSLCVTEL